MKFRITSMMAVLMVLSSYQVRITDPGTLTKKERSFAVDYLKDTRDQLFKNISKLSESQWLFKSSDESWNIAMVAEHIALAESVIMNRVNEVLQSEPDYDKKLDMESRIEFVKNFTTNRDQKFQARPAVAPEGKWQNPGAFIKHFKALRNQSIEYVKNTDDALHSHFSPTSKLFGDMDAYLWIVFMAGHNQRHIMQIREIMNHPDFPDE